VLPFENQRGAPQECSSVRRRSQAALWSRFNWRWRHRPKWSNHRADCKIDC